MYDYDEMMRVWVNAMVEFEPDMYENPFTIRYLGRMMETLDFKQLKWPGHGCDDMTSYQYVEGEYMKDDEYDAFLFDPSDFMLRTYWPRIFGAFEPFKDLPPIHSIITYYMGMPAFAAFDSPEVETALDALLKVAKEAKILIGGAVEYAKKMKQLGFPPPIRFIGPGPIRHPLRFFQRDQGGYVGYV